MGRHHANILEPNGWCIPSGPICPWTYRYVHGGGGQTPIDSKEAWTPFFNKATLDVPGTPAQQTHSAYPKQQESATMLISTVRDRSRPLKRHDLPGVWGVVIRSVKINTLHGLRKVRSLHQSRKRTEVLEYMPQLICQSFFGNAIMSFVFVTHSADLSHNCITLRQKWCYWRCTFGFWQTS